MKNVMKTMLAAACVVWMSSASAAVLEPKVECKNNTCEKFRVGMYRIKNTLTMNFLMEKEKGERVSLRLMDKKGKVIHQESVGKSIIKFGRKFNFSEVEDGLYILEISNDHERIVKNIHLSSKEVREVQGRTLITMN
ncbi:hypothetical protein [Dyadobacter sp. 32]|uniref:hypothetical protein n=1 Tax=Dyadobacter sp. 32 TaxID=538966 RepID=UPI0011EFCCDB